MAKATPDEPASPSRSRRPRRSRVRASRPVTVCGAQRRTLRPDPIGDPRAEAQRLVARIARDLLESPADELRLTEAIGAVGSSSTPTRRRCSRSRPTTGRCSARAVARPVDPGRGPRSPNVSRSRRSRGSPSTSIGSGCRSSFPGSPTSRRPRRRAPQPVELARRAVRSASCRCGATSRTVGRALRRLAARRPAAVAGADGAARHHRRRAPERAGPPQRRERAARLRSRFRAVLRESPDVVVIWGEDGSVEFASAALERITGVAGSAFDFEHAPDLVHSDDVLGMCVRYGSHCRNRASPCPSPSDPRRRRVEWRHLEGTYTNLLDEPFVAGVVLNARDVTDRVGLEVELSQAQKMAALGRMAGSIAHDFRNLTFAMRSFGGARPRPRRARRTLDDGAAGDRARLHPCRLAGVPAPGVRSAVRDRSTAVAPARVLEELRPAPRTARPRRRRVSSSCRVPTCPVFGISGTQLEQILVNLTTNAIDAMPDGGRLRVALDDRAEGCASHRGRRHRRRHGRGRAQPGVRAVLHDEDERRGQRARALDRLRGDGRGRRAPSPSRATWVRGPRSGSSLPPAEGACEA